jgi:Flp pilus assembly pilin Flp
MIKNLQKSSKSLAKRVRSRRSRGASSVEYIIVLIFIAVAGIALFQKFGTEYKEKITTANDKFGTVKP